MKKSREQFLGRDERAELRDQTLLRRISVRRYPDGE